MLEFFTPRAAQGKEHFILKLFSYYFTFFLMNVNYF